MSDQADRHMSFVRPLPVPRLATFAADPAPVDVDLARSALVIVDMQNDFIHPDGWFPASGIDPAPLSAAVPAVAVLADTARRAGMPVVWVNWGVRPDRANLPDSFVARAANDGAVIDELPVGPADLVVSKHRPSGFPDTELDSVLRLRDLTTLFFAGVNIDRCVLATLIDASARGYDCVLVADACATSSPPHVTDAVCHIVRLLYGVTANSSDICPAIAGATAGKS